MAVLEVFIHAGCSSEQMARQLANALQQEFPSWKVRIDQAMGERAQALGIIIAPAFVLDGTLLVVGVPNKEWLIRQLHEHIQRTPTATSD